MDPRLLAVVLLTAAALVTPLFTEGFKELFRQVFKRGRRGSWWLLPLAALLQLALVVSPFILLVGIMSRYGLRQPDEPAASIEQPSPEVAQPGGDSQPAEGGGEPISGVGDGWMVKVEPTAVNWTAWAIIVVLLTLAAVVVVYAAVDAWLEHRSSGSEGARLDTYEGMLLEATREALHEVEEGGDPRGAIVSYFLKLCKLLQEQGVDVSEDMTAREIAAVALQRFRRLNPIPLKRLVEIFEEARYSDHCVDEGMRGEALACFAAIRDSLAGGGVGGWAGSSPLGFSSCNRRSRPRAG